MKRLMQLMAIGIMLLCTTLAQAGDPTLHWDASTGNVEGYRIYFSATIGDYDNMEDVGNVTQFPLSGLTILQDPGTTRHFIVRAYNETGESGNSNNVTFYWPIPLPGEPGNVRVVTETTTQTTTTTKTTVIPFNVE